MIIRYVDKDLRAVESLIGFVELDKQTGAAISDQILKHLRKLGINLNHMVAQTGHKKMGKWDTSYCEKTLPTCCVCGLL